MGREMVRKSLCTQCFPKAGKNRFFDSGGAEVKKHVVCTGPTRVLSSALAHIQPGPLWETDWLPVAQQTLSQQTNLLPILMWSNKLQKHFPRAILFKRDSQLAGAREGSVPPRYCSFRKKALWSHPHSLPLSLSLTVCVCALVMKFSRLLKRSAQHFDTVGKDNVITCAVSSTVQMRSAGEGERSQSMTSL